MNNYQKLCFFYENPEVALKLFNLRSLCNQMFKCIKRSDFTDYIASEFFYYIMPEAYDFPFVLEELGDKQCYNLLKKIIRRFPGLVEYIDDRVFGSKYFVRDFTDWRGEDEFIYNKIMRYIKDKHTDLYEKYNLNQWMKCMTPYDDTDYETENDDEFVL